jgi:hypothetical protein
LPFRAFESIMFLVEQAHWYYEVRAGGRAVLLAVSGKD